MTGDGRNDGAAAAKSYTLDMEAPDRDHRDRARFRLDANVVVEAGAGTGKTTLLTDRILFLVLGWDKPAPVSIDRVRAALEDLDKAPIGTIHSFCAQLLRLHPVEAGLDPAFRVDADEEAFDDL